jgi:hypothetical protein
MHNLFLTWTQISHYIFWSFIAIYTQYTTFPPNLTPCIWNRRTPFYLVGEPASLLVVMNAHPPFSLVCQQLPHPLLCPSHPFTPYSSGYTIYIDGINNNLGRLRPGQEQSISFMLWTNLNVAGLRCLHAVQCHTSDINEELGLVTHLLTDKTGPIDLSIFINYVVEADAKNIKINFILYKYVEWYNNKNFCG